MDTQPRPIAGVKRVMVFGGSGMVGQGVIRECLADPEVEQVITVGRTATGTVHDKIREIEHADMSEFESISEDLKNIDAVFWSLGVSSADVSKEKYEVITRDYTLAAAKVLLQHNPNMTFVYVSGEGTDAESSTHWQRIKGGVENSIIEMPWHGYAFRLAMLEAKNKETSKTGIYRKMYKALGWALIPLTRTFMPAKIITTEQLGRGFLELSRRGTDKKVLYSPDMITLSQAAIERNQASL